MPPCMPHSLFGVAGRGRGIMAARGKCSYFIVYGGKIRKTRVEGQISDFRFLLDFAISVKIS